MIVKGDRLTEIGDILLMGCDEGAKSLEIVKFSETQVEVLIPPLPRGLYYLQFILKNGMIGHNETSSPWFGINGLLVTTLP